MFRKLLVTIVLCVILSGCSNNERAGIEIITNPSAKIYINGKEAGTTPYRNKNLKPGFMQLKVVWGETNGKGWEQGIKLQPYTDTVIDVSLQKDSVSGYILGLEPKENKEQAGLMLATYPANAVVSIDSEVAGYAPLRINNWSEGDKHIKLILPGYKPQDVYAKLIKGYELSLIGFLAEDNQTEPAPVVAAIVKSTIQMAKIKATPLGFLRVRESSSINSKELARIKPGERYEIVAILDDWISVRVKDELIGWVKKEFVDIQPKEEQ